MQALLFKYTHRICMLAITLLISVATFAQDEIEIDKEEIGSWFERNWIWVVGGLVLLILIVALARGSRRGQRTIEGGTRSTTTVIKDAGGNTRSVTTTEENL